MNHFICRLIGHQEYSDEVLRLEPWLEREFAHYAPEDFREENCVRCGEKLAHEVAA